MLRSVMKAVQIQTTQTTQMVTTQAEAMIQRLRKKGQYRGKESSARDQDAELDEVDPDDLEVEMQVGEEHLHAVVGKDGKGVCFEFARTGKCRYKEKFGECGYSHDPEDVATFKAVEKMGPGYVQRASRMMAAGARPRPGPPRKSSVSVAYNPGHKGTSPGMRPPFRKRASGGAQRSGRRDV